VLASIPGGIPESEAFEQLVPFTYCPLELFHLKMSHLQTAGHIFTGLAAARRQTVTSVHSVVGCIGPLKTNFERIYGWHTDLPHADTRTSTHKHSHSHSHNVCKLNKYITHPLRSRQKVTVELVVYFTGQRWSCYAYEPVITHLLPVSVHRNLVRAFNVTMNFHPHPSSRPAQNF